MLTESCFTTEQLNIFVDSVVKILLENGLCLSNYLSAIAFLILKILVSRQSINKALWAFDYDFDNQKIELKLRISEALVVVSIFSTDEINIDSCNKMSWYLQCWP